MARVFITGSADGLGRMAAQLLIEQGHTVILHARNQKRGQEAMAAVPGAETVVVGDTEVDFEFARAAGCRVVLVPGGSRTREELSGVTPDAMLGSIAELPEWLTSFADRK